MDARESIAPAGHAFVIMQVGSEHSEDRARADEVCRYVIDPVLGLAEFDLGMVRADQDATPGSITPKMIGDLLSAFVVIADLTGRNPNVYYELGIAHSFGKAVIALGQPAGLPFDVQDERVIALPGRGEKLGVQEAETAKERLAAALRIVQKDGYTPTSPLSSIASTRVLEDLAPSNPVAAELTALRERVDEMGVGVTRLLSSRDTNVAKPTQLLSSSSNGPTVLRLSIGAYLRAVREAAGVSREDAGWEIRASESKISRMELGRVVLKERDVEDLLTLYGVADNDERTRLLSMVRDANSGTLRYRHYDLFTDRYQMSWGLESAAVQIRTYEPLVVPSLLQTVDYARAVIRGDHPGATADDVERWVDLRIARQRMLFAEEPVKLWAIVSEAAIRRPIGDRDVMRAQIDALIEAVALPNVTLQLIPAYSAVGTGTGGFTVLRFPDAETPDVVYVEQLTSAFYLDREEDVDRYHRLLEVLTVVAEPRDEATRFLRKLADLLDR
jgi:hypothetical protein